jgi:hypothetical protein
MSSKKVEVGRTYLGVVEDNQDPEKSGRLKIKVLDVFDDMPKEDIPWAAPWKDLNGNEFNVPEIGKVLIVVFDQGDLNKPEFIFSEHYNINLETKLKSLSDVDYISMKSLIYDHRTQIYVNESEGLKIDHKYNNINITENSINFNMKDNMRSINIGDSTANQQMILGTNFMEWFDEFIDHLMGQRGGAFLSPLPCLPNPTFMPLLLKFKALKDPKFLSHHVNIVDNSKTSTVKSESDIRQDESQVGDGWNSTKRDNTFTTKTDEDFKPQPGEKPQYSDKFKAPSIEVPNLDNLKGLSVDSLSKLTGITGITSSSSLDAIKNKSTNAIDGAKTNATGLIDDAKTKTSGLMDSAKSNLSDVKNSIRELEPPTSPTANKKIEELIRFMFNKEYTVYEEIGELNMLSMRKGTSVDRKVTNSFDEKLYVFYKDDKLIWQLFEYDVTTLPGLIPGTELLPENVSILRLGQYVDQLEMSLLDGDQEHSCLKFENCAIQRNINRNKYDFTSPSEIGNFPMNIHRSSSTSTADYVFNYSEGSQVFKNINQYNQFMNLCNSQIQVAKKDRFTYTLVLKQEYDEFTVVKPDQLKLNKYEKYLGKLK